MSENAALGKLPALPLVVVRILRRLSRVNGQGQRMGAPGSRSEALNRARKARRALLPEIPVEHHRDVAHQHPSGH
jgi:hypothetical protein